MIIVWAICAAHWQVKCKNILQITRMKELPSHDRNNWCNRSELYRSSKWSIFSIGYVWRVCKYCSLWLQYLQLALPRTIPSMPYAFSQIMALNLIGVAEVKGDTKMIDSYWNTYCCHSKSYSVFPTFEHQWAIVYIPLS
jgi:hypothetical protein